jgi:hypothetical protein
MVIFNFPSQLHQWLLAQSIYGFNDTAIAIDPQQSADADEGKQILGNVG